MIFLAYYIMRASALSNLLRRYGAVFCPVCGRSIFVGESVFSQHCGSRCKIFHKSCWDSRFIDV